MATIDSPAAAAGSPELPARGAPRATGRPGRAPAGPKHAAEQASLAKLVTGPLRRVGLEWRDPLLRNGYALLLNVGVTSVLGLVYWIAAARFYTAAEVGLAVSAINLMTFLAGIGGQLSFQSALTRFIPHAGRDSSRLALLAYTCAGGAGALVSVIYLVLTHFPALGVPVVLGKTWILSVGLGGSVTVWCIFALQDAVLTGIRQAVWIPVENGSYGVAKIVVLIGLARVMPNYGIFSSWTIPAFVALFPVNWLIFRRLLPRHVAEQQGSETTVTLRMMSRYMGGDYLGTIFNLGVGAILPLLILARLGKDAAGYFGEVYVIVYALDLITVNLGTALMVHGVVDRTSLRSATETVGRRIALLVLPTVAVLVAFAPLVLSIYGREYAANASGLLRLMAVAVVAKAITSLYIALCRLERRVSWIAFAQGAVFVLVCALAWVLMGRLSLGGVGIAYLITHVAVAAFALPAVLRILNRDLVVPAGTGAPEETR
ncbi:MAG TPA: lipopolysaccharide biosynthesis protein [Actinomycetota bacterium]|nr:lipopolysaccharide biosynthesis protein [Actinomycetota bacterium]